MKGLTGAVVAIGAVCLLSAQAVAAEIRVQVDEVMAGSNGDSKVQFIELKMEGAGENLWGPQGVETNSRLIIEFFDATGAKEGQFDFPSDPPSGALSVLIATSVFAGEAGMPTPDFIMPAGLMAVDGKLCVRGNPANGNAPDLNLCLSYGNFVGSTGTDTGGHMAGAPAAYLPTTDAISLKRFNNLNNYGGDGHYNFDFVSGAAAPRNSAGSTGTISIKALVEQGEKLFMDETFNGNGRTCHTCHRPPDQFGLSANSVSLLPPSDPLFVHETDANLTALENACLVRSVRVLNLENIDGFDQPPVFRGAPHLLNLAETAPYGHSAEFADLKVFTTGAVAQHMPRTMVRNSDPNAGPLDFRNPTIEELNAMEAFMLSIKMPADGDFNLDRMIAAAIDRGADAAAIQRGRDLFAGDAKCFLCHSGPVLGEADVQLGGGNQKFNTGVVNLPINQFDACLNFDPLPPEDSGNREFDTPQLIGVSLTAPYFHDNSTLTLDAAIRTYKQPQFNNSPGGILVGGITLTEPEIADLKAFLEALIEPTPVDCNTNGVDDFKDVSGSTSVDCNGNAIPDACELDGNDCNTNGSPDECDRRPVTFATPVSEALGDGPRFVTHLDVDGDGDEDLISANWIGTNITVRLNNGDGTFVAGGSFAVLSVPRSIAFADLDADGDVDAVVSNLINANISVLMNNGDDGLGGWLGFAAAQNFPAGGFGTLSLITVDVNNDGKTDVVTCNNFNNNCYVLRNNGNNGMGVWQGLTAPVGYGVGGVGAWMVTSAKLNADNFYDLVVTVRDSDKVSVLMNNGLGNFLPPVLYTVEDAPEALVTGDWDNDGVTDLVVANSETDTLSVFLNNGDGTLGAPSQTVVGSYPFGARPLAIVAADINADGNVDLVTANEESDNISVILGNGMGAFTTLVNLTVPEGPEAVTVADFNGDNTLDIATGHFVSDMGVLLFNETPPFGGDCNGNGVPDVCDIASMLSTDINLDGAPDECEPVGDINDDGMFDGQDVIDFVNVLLGVNTNPVHVFRSDVNTDGQADGLDVGPFVEMLYSN